MNQPVALTGVSETALLTLNGRAHQAGLPGAILHDPMAIQLRDAIAFDYDKFGRKGQEMALRSLAVHGCAKAYLRDHPKATVVALGQMFFDLPPVMVKKLAPKGMRSSKNYRVPPMPFSLTVDELAELVHTMPGVTAVHDIPMPRGRGFFFEKVFPAIWAFRPARNVHGAYTLLEFG